MSDTRVKCHPTLGVLVCTDGHILVPQNGANRAHWYYGSPNRQGYCQVRINGSLYKVHRLIAETFIPNPENKHEIDHINRNPQDNRVENLRWATRTENNRNTRSNDKCESKYGVHQYEDHQEYNSLRAAQWHRTERGRVSREKYLEKYRKTHTAIRCADGKYHRVTREQATELLKLRVSERFI